MFPGPRVLSRMRRILCEKLARSLNHVDPIVEGMRQGGHQILERTFFQTAALVEAVVRHMAEIRLRLLHHGHVEEHAGLPDLVVRAETPDAPG